MQRDPSEAEHCRAAGARYAVESNQPQQAFVEAIERWLRAARSRRCLYGLKAPRPGLAVLDSGSGARLRTAFVPEECFFACEYDDCDENWELMLVRDATDQLHTGWRRRRGPNSAASPAEWEAMTSRLRLGPAVDAAIPDFLTLSALAVNAGVVVRVQSPRPGGADLGDAHWRQIAKQQAPLLRAQRLALRQRPGDASLPGPPSAPAPTTLGELEQWAAARADQIVVLPRAIAAAKRSQPEAVGLVYDALEMLAELYPATKKGSVPRDALKRRCVELGLSIGRSIDAGRAGQAGDDYFVTYKGRRRFLESHLGRGNSRDSRFILRIYFFYDEEDEVVVVGWLPTHLSNSMT